jgi:hydroxymethylpyrimidine pyrophosphatase-like HAD family hydrolase
MHIAHKYDIALENNIAIGDSINDLCMIEQAGMGVAFCTKNMQLRVAADKIIDKLSFADLLDTDRLFTRKRMVEQLTA